MEKKKHYDKDTRSITGERQTGSHQTVDKHRNTPKHSAQYYLSSCIGINHLSIGALGAVHNDHPPFSCCLDDFHEVLTCVRSISCSIGL